MKKTIKYISVFINIGFNNINMHGFFYAIKWFEVILTS